MEFSFAYYPMIKLLVFVLIASSLFYLSYYKKKWKIALVIGVVFAVFYSMIPVRIDGTETHKAMQHEQMKQTDKYKEQSKNTPKVTTKVLTFDEKMALIDKKNKVKNDEIKKEIYK